MDYTNTKSGALRGGIFGGLAALPIYYVTLCIFGPDSQIPAYCLLGAPTAGTAIGAAKGYIDDLTDAVASSISNRGCRRY